MKHGFLKSAVIAAVLLLITVLPTRAQTFSVPWFVVANGGGTASGGGFVTTGTFGQWEAADLPATGGDFTVTAGFWSFLAAPTILFSDNFAGNSVDPSKWIATGYSVIETNGTMEVLDNAANNGGVLTSLPFLVNPTGVITITRGVFLHAQPSSQPNYPGTYFMGQFGITIGSLPQFSVNYANMAYGDGVTYMPRYGFFLARDGASPLYIVDKSNVSPEIPPVWDTWFNETITYDPSSGLLEYYINNVSQMVFNVGPLPPTNAPFMQLTFSAWGWWTGHEQLFNNLYVTQTGLLPVAPGIDLGGKLAFGGVPVNTSSNLTLAITNIGSGPLTVSNISYPAGFSGAWSGVIPAGSTQAVTVTFSPTAGTNYSGTIAVTSDAISGASTIPVSGYGLESGLKLIIDIIGKGKVSPNLNGKKLVKGEKYTVEAIPDTDYVFAGWTGSVVTNRREITFKMEPGTLLQANFEPSPFLASAGTYNGLFSTTNGVTEETAGMLKDLTVTRGGAYSGSLLLDGTAHPIGGAFSLSGLASNYIARAGSQDKAVTIALTLNTNASPPLTGIISGAHDGVPWTASLTANRDGTNGSADYTMVLAPTVFGFSTVPSGYGYATMEQHKGILTISGALADGIAVNQTVPVSTVGTVPVFANLYNDTGLITGWLDLSGSAPSGNLTWIKKASKSGRYREGFTNTVVAQGSAWTNRSPAAAINLSAGQLNLSGGTLASTLSYTVTITKTNELKVTSGSTSNALTGSINPKTGVLTLSFVTKRGKPRTVGKGVVLQATTNGAGFFLDPTNAGSIILDP
jgi:hypothetical protein